MKTTILTHADCDGICAGAIALAKFPDANMFFTKPVSLYHDLMNTEADRIIIADIALTKRDAPKIVKLFGEKGEIQYFDHHIIPRTVKKQEIGKRTKVFLHELDTSSSELIYRYYQKEIPRERVWIAIYGAIGDYSDDTEFVKERILNWDRRALFFEVSTIVLGTKNEEFESYNAKRRIARTLARGENPSDVPGLVRSAKRAVNREFDLYEIIKRKAKTYGKIAYVKDLPSFGFRGPSALFAATVRGKPLGLYVHVRDRYVDITMRARAKLRLNELAEKAAEEVSGSGGGHPEAAGAKIPVGSFNTFLKKLDKMMKKLDKMIQI
jgi:single-stranded-DNA-specific exonuclease